MKKVNTTFLMLMFFATLISSCKKESLQIPQKTDLEKNAYTTLQGKMSLANFNDID